MPIRCATEQLKVILRVMPCEVIDFPCKYLGLPLSVRKVTDVDLQPIMDKIVDMLPGWKAVLMYMAGHVVLVKAVRTAVLLYTLIALDVPKCLLHAISYAGPSFGSGIDR